MSLCQVCVECGFETTPHYWRSHQVSRHDSDVMAMSDEGAGLSCRGGLSPRLINPHRGSLEALASKGNPLSSMWTTPARGEETAVSRTTPSISSDHPRARGRDLIGQGIRQGNIGSPPRAGTRRQAFPQ